jgi:purine-binding chemotaxis protein CheW
MDQAQRTVDVMWNGQGVDEDEAAPEVVREILRRRAAELAKALAETERGEQLGVLLVQLGRELYGIDARYVERVQQVEHITRVPRVPDWVVGMTNLRGRLCSVIDLIRFFGLPAESRARQNDEDREHRSGLDAYHEDGGRRNYLIVVETEHMDVALLVADVLTVETIPVSRIQEAGGKVRGLRPEYVRGVTEYQGDDGKSGMVTVLDLPTLLAEEQLTIHQEIV